MQFLVYRCACRDRPHRRSSHDVHRSARTPQLIRHPLRRHPSRDRRPVGQFSPNLFDGGDHQFGDAAFGEMGGRMAPRLILVSNRVSIPDSKSPRVAGGLTVAVNAALKQREGVWFGWSGNVSENGAVPAPTITRRRMRTYVTLDLSATDFQEYYNGFANRVLWPILHYRVDLAEFTAVDLGSYLRVNARFAEALSQYIRPDDTIWVHDYHLLPLAKQLRALGHGNLIGFFLHIPCPPPDILLALPQHAETLGTLGHYDLVGVQTEHDADNLRRYFELPGGISDRSRSSFDRDGCHGQIRAFPVAIDTQGYARVASNAMRSKFAEEMRDSLGGWGL